MYSKKYSSKHFLTAAKLIDKNGLAKGTFHDEKGRFCALGALRVAAPEITYWDMVASSIGVPSWTPKYGAFAVVNFNDMKSTKKEHVVTFLLLCSEMAKGVK